jgi:group I intron endonuclease
MIIYKTTNLINNKIYIGQDSYNNPNYLGSGNSILTAIKKYGRENFKKEILEFCKTKEELNKREEFWIKELDSYNFNVGYNLSEKGVGSRKGYTHSEETKKKMSEDRLGKPKSEEFKKKIKGQKRTKEVKKQMSISRLILTKKDIEGIIFLLNNTKLTLKSIGEIYNVSDILIYEIKANKSFYNKHYNFFYEENLNNLRGYKYSKEQIEEVLNLLKENLSNKKIEEKTKVDSSVVSEFKFNKSTYNKLYNLWYNNLKININ